MTPQKIRMLDLWLGLPVCAFLTLFEKARRHLVKAPQLPPRRIVFVKLIEMGSTVLAAPAFSEAVKRVGRENVFLLLFRRNRPIADVMQQLPEGNIIEVDDASLRRFSMTLFSALCRIRRERIDTAVDLEGLTRASAIITWLTGARRRVGYYNFTAEGPYRGRLFNYELNYNFQRHVTTDFLAMTQAAFVSCSERPLLKERVGGDIQTLPRFTPLPAEQEALRGKIAHIAGRRMQGPMIILNPNCSDLLPLRRWPDACFIELGQRILADHPCAAIAVTGAPGEQRGSEAIARAIDPAGQKCFSLAGHTTFRELMVLLTMAEALVSNDSGPCHFAALTDIAVVALFGPETEQRYGPLGKRLRTLNAGLACSPCVSMLNHRFSPCDNNRCMRELSVETVYGALRALCFA